MKYCSIDIETTGLNPNNCNIIEFAAVIDDLTIQAPIEKLLKFQTYILQDTYVGEPYALGMHGEIFKKIALWERKGITISYPDELFKNFHTFLTTLGGYTPNKDGIVSINVAGKNFAFDNKFLEKLDNSYLVNFAHRVLDPTMLYLDLEFDKFFLPSTATCLERAGICDAITHTALEDAITVIKLLRHKLPRK